MAEEWTEDTALGDTTGEPIEPTVVGKVRSEDNVVKFSDELLLCECHEGSKTPDIAVCSAFKTRHIIDAAGVIGEVACSGNNLEEEALIDGVVGSTDVGDAVVCVATGFAGGMDDVTVTGVTGEDSV